MYNHNALSCKEHIKDMFIKHNKIYFEQNIISLKNNTASYYIACELKQILYKVLIYIKILKLHLSLLCVDHLIPIFRHILPSELYECN